MIINARWDKLQKDSRGFFNNIKAAPDNHECNEDAEESIYE